MWNSLSWVMKAAAIMAIVLANGGVLLPWLLKNLMIYGVFMVLSLQETLLQRKLREKSTIQPGMHGGKGSAARVKVKLEIKVVGDPEYDRDGCCLRVRGKIESSDAYVATGAFHTIEIKPELPFELKKKVWEKSQLERLLTRCM